MRVRKGVSCGCDEVSDNATLHPMLLSAKVY